MTYPNEISRTAKQTANGAAYTELSIQPYGVADATLVCIPASVADGAAVNLAIAAHGSGGNEQQINLARMVSTRDGMLDRGWIVASAMAHDRAWANDTALADFTRVHDWVNDTWQVTHTLLHGESMGGLTMMVLASQARIPTVRAVVSIDGALNLRAAYDQAGQTYGAQIRTAYGIASDGSDYAAKTAGHDAVLLNMTTFNRIRLFVEGSPNDLHIPKTSHSDVFVANLGNNALELVTRTGTGTHVTAENFFPADVLAFYDNAIANAPADPPPPIIPDLPAGPMVTNIETKAWTGKKWEPATVQLWNRTAWAAPAAP